MKSAVIAFAVLFTLPALAADPAPLAVDFLNQDGRSVSVKLGSSAGAVESMNFSVLDPAGKPLASIYPYEILPDRFWSGPLDPAVFARMRVGFAVVRAELDPEQAMRLRADTQQRANALREQQRAARKVQLQKQINDLGRQMDALIQQADSLQAREKDLRDKAFRERRNTLRDLDRAESDLDDKLRQIDDLGRQKDDLWEQRFVARTRDNPSPAQIEDLTRQIARLDDRISRLRSDLVDLRARARDVRTKALEGQDLVDQAQGDLGGLWVRFSTLNAQRQRLQEELNALP